VEPNLENDAMRDYGVNGIESKTANQTRKTEKREGQKDRGKSTGTQSRS
jgi:hypothetical protein